jgi:hypothetical protein
VIDKSHDSGEIVTVECKERLTGNILRRLMDHPDAAQHEGHITLPETTHLGCHKGVQRRFSGRRARRRDGP